MTEPLDPTDPADRPAAADEPPADAPAYPTGPSLSERLAELEPDDDEPLFDVDPYDDDEPEVAYEPMAYEPYPPPYEPAPIAVDLTHPAPEAAPAAEPGTAYDDSAFAAADATEAPTFAAAPDADPPPSVGELHDEVHDGLHDGLHDDLRDLHAIVVETVPPTAPATPTDVPPPDDGALAAAGANVAASRRRGRRRAKRTRRIGAPVLALLLTTALMAAATAYLWLEVRDRRQVEDARRAGLDAGRDAARLLFSYDYRTLQKDFGTGRALTTGEFRKEYEKTTTRLVEDAAVRYKAVVKANVVQAGVVRATGDSVVAVIYVNQVTTSTRVTGEKVDLSRVRMTLREIGGRWLVERVDAL